MTVVGVIGLGKMGLPLAGNLVERGFQVVGFQRHGAAGLVAIGGEGADSPQDLAERADVIVSILPDADALDEVVCGPSGTLRTMRAGTVHIEMSTIDVDRKRAVRDAVQRAGGDLLDSPISGSPGMVAPRAATTFVSGAKDSVEHVRGVLDALSGPWIYTGPFGAGASMKYIANLLVAIHTAAAAEALTLARSAGLDLGMVQRTLDDSIASSAILRQRGPRMAQREWLPAPGPIATLHSILRQIDATAAAAELDLPVFAAAKSLFDAAMRDGWATYDIAAVHDRVSPPTEPPDPEVEP